MSKNMMETVERQDMSLSSGADLCQHFGICGGCSLQHLKQEEYQCFKTDNFKNAVRSLSAESVLGDTIFIPDHTRRRTTFSLYKSGALYMAGFKRQKSLKIVPIKECRVLHPALEQYIPFLNYFKDFIPHDIQVKVSLTLVDDGVDMVVSGCKSPEGEKLTRFLNIVKTTDMTRVLWNNDLIYQRIPSEIDFSGAIVPFSANAFLQPSAEGQKVLQDIVFSYVSAKKKLKIIDLFAGLGTFSFGLSERHDVHAVECERSAIEAQNRARRTGQMKKNVHTFEIRDLFRDPLSVFELNKYDVAVCNPPRQGAEAQVITLAQSKIKTVIMVSCSPQTFVRDAEILTKNGFKLKGLTPVDQFIYSTHLECIAFFSR